VKTDEIVSKLWNLCNVLRDDGITYHQYVTELTYILFLKMTKETETEDGIPQKYRWDQLIKKQGIELKKFYIELLSHLGEKCKGRIRDIYTGARTNIDEPKNLEKIILNINELDWYSAKEEGLGDLYEGLLEKNANEKKSGAGQYFTPRVLINVMTKLINPQKGEHCNDPACGTFGFMIAANRHVKELTDDYHDLSIDEQNFQKEKAFTGCELVPDAHRLALMNAMLHGIEGEILQADTLSNHGKNMYDFDVVLTNPPFGTKKGSERATRDDLTFPTSNKQLNFLQHIYRSLKHDGKARAAVVLPDNVLFDEDDGSKIRADLMDKCNLHTVLRLPKGIFYARSVKPNVLFFTRSKTDKGNTKEVWFYDMRTNMPSFGKTTPLLEEHFDGFVAAYTAKNRNKISDERFTRFSHEEIATKANSLDLGLIRDDAILDYGDLQDPVETGDEIITELEEATDLMMSVVTELKSFKGRN